MFDIRWLLKGIQLVVKTNQKLRIGHIRLPNTGWIPQYFEEFLIALSNYSTSFYALPSTHPSTRLFPPFLFDFYSNTNVKLLALFTPSHPPIHQSIRQTFTPFLFDFYLNSNVQFFQLFKNYLRFFNMTDLRQVTWLL